MTQAQITSWLKETAYWSTRSGGSNLAGSPTWTTPSTIKVHTESVRRRKVVGNISQEVQVDLVTALAVLIKGDRFWPQGADQTDPTKASRIGEVATVTDKWSGITTYEAELES